MKMKIKNVICIPIIIASAIVPSALYAINSSNTLEDQNDSSSVQVYGDASIVGRTYSGETSALGDDLNIEDFPEYNNSVYRPLFDKYILTGETYCLPYVPINEAAQTANIVSRTYTSPWTIPEYDAMSNHGKLYFTMDSNTQEEKPVYLLTSSSEINDDEINLTNSKVSQNIMNILSSAYPYVTPEEYTLLSNDDFVYGTQLAVYISNGVLPKSALEEAQLLVEENEKDRAEQLMEYINDLLNSTYEEKYFNVDLNSDFSLDTKVWDVDEINENSVHGEIYVPDDPDGSTMERELLMSGECVIDSNYKTVWVASYNDELSTSLDILDGTTCLNRSDFDADHSSFRVSYSLDDLKSIPLLSLTGLDISEMRHVTRPEGNTDKLIFSCDDISKNLYSDSNGNIFYIAENISDIYFYDYSIDLSEFSNLYKTATLNVSLKNKFTGASVTNSSVLVTPKEEANSDSNSLISQSLSCETDDSGMCIFKNVPEGDYIISTQNSQNYMDSTECEISVDLSDIKNKYIKEIDIEIEVPPVYFSLNLIDAATNESLPSTPFDLYHCYLDESGEQIRDLVGSFESDSNGNVLVYNIPAGNYQVVVNKESGTLIGDVYASRSSDSDPNEVLDVLLGQEM